MADSIEYKKSATSLVQEGSPRDVIWENGAGHLPDMQPSAVMPIVKPPAKPSKPEKGEGEKKS